MNNRANESLSKVLMCLLIAIAVWLGGMSKVSATLLNLKLNPPLVTNGNIGFVEISSPGNQVVYRADQDTDAVNELYSVPITGGATVKLNGRLVVGGGTGSFRISPDGSRPIYKADQDTDNVFELYMTNLNSI
jgi:hypothetical protein